MEVCYASLSAVYLSHLSAKLAHKGQFAGGQAGQGGCVRRLVAYSLVVSSKMQVIACSIPSQV